MPKLVIWERCGTEEAVKSQIEVVDLHEATIALGNDLLNTASSSWATQVMDKWEENPGRVSMEDGDVTWVFEYTND